MKQQFSNLKERLILKTLNTTVYDVRVSTVDQIIKYIDDYYSFKRILRMFLPKPKQRVYVRQDEI